MTPSVKAIQCRIKEAFALKIDPDIWDELESQILVSNYQLPCFKLNKEQRDIVLKERGLYQFHSDDIYKHEKPASESFYIKNIDDYPPVGQQIKVMFLSGHPEW